MLTSTLEHEAFPFDKLKVSDFPSALLQGLRLSQARVESVKNSPEAPTYANTIEALDLVSEPMDQAMSIFSLYRSVMKNARIEAYGDRLDPLFTKFSNAIFTDPKLFERVNHVYEHQASANLNGEQKLLLKKTYQAFVRNGAKLGPAEKAKVLEIDNQLVKLGTRFKKNVSDATNGYSLVITDPQELAGLPDSAIAAAAEEGRKRKKEGTWVFTLHAPSVIPFLSYLNNRSLREKMWRAYSGRASAGDTDNRQVLVEIARLKAEKARILGYATYAHFKLEDRMAKNPETVETFLNDLTKVYRPAAERDLAELEALAGHPLQTWDFGYYTEKLQEQKYSFKSEDLRPYFRLDRVLQGAFFAASRLYGVKFVAKPNLPTWDATVQAFEVRDKDNQFLSLFYFDPFPRESKRQGAWMTDIRGAGEYHGADRRPHVLNVGNLTPPLEGQEATLTWDEVRTIFHELGHGLHSMMTRVKTPSLAGTSVTWDFVELPSQFFENWAIQPEVLDVYARHKDTGERIPEALIGKVRRAETFQAGYRGLRQVMLASLDMAWHSRDLSSVSVANLEAWEQAITDPYRLLPKVPGFSSSTTFSHVFAGGYSAGYYSYKWSEVLAADAFEMFKKNGVFDAATAQRFLTEILERGGTEEADVLYLRFRGQAPDPKALPRSEGLSQ